MNRNKPRRRSPYTLEIKPTAKVNARELFHKIEKCKHALADIRPMLSTETFQLLTTETIKKYRHKISGKNTFPYIAKLSRMINGHRVSFDIAVGSPFLEPNERHDMLMHLRNEIKAYRNAMRNVRPIRHTVYHNTDSLVRHGGVYLNEGSIFRLFQQRQAVIVFEEKKPESRRKHVGVEIEFYAPNSSSRAVIAEQLNKFKVSKYCNLTTDPSIKGFSENFKGHELRVLCEQTEYARVIKRVCLALEKCRAKVNKSCGLHVHLDTRYAEPAVMFSNLVNALPLLRKLVPESRRDNPFSLQNQTNKIEEYSKPRTREQQTRYWSINPHALVKHKTIEIRMHTGTVNARKIVSWISLLRKIAYGPATIKPVEFISRIQGVPRRLGEFIEHRIERFSNSTNEEEEHAVA